MKKYKIYVNEIEKKRICNCRKRSKLHSLCNLRRKKARSDFSPLLLTTCKFSD